MAAQHTKPFHTRVMSGFLLWPSGDGRGRFSYAYLTYNKHR